MKPLTLKNSEGRDTPRRTASFLKTNAFTVFSISLIILTAAAITVTAIIFKQVWWKTVPLYVSLLVGLFQMRASRYASLVGGTNSVLYAGVNLAEGLPGQSAYSLFVSCPFQIATFIRWSKNKYKQSTKFRRLGRGGRGLVALIFGVCMAITCIILTAVGSGYVILDAAMMLIGVFTMLLTLFSFVEYSWFMLCTGVVSIILDAVMMADNPARITFLVFSVYSMICVTLQFITVQRLYKEQQRGE
ncbi:MAG: nicotinamide mononucleotide transporter [Clostridia bacterium]|nr:nicotinamide mononucleotide transporter [Clostridia bacterium]